MLAEHLLGLSSRDCRPLEPRANRALADMYQRPTGAAKPRNSLIA